MKKVHPERWQSFCNTQPKDTRLFVVDESVRYDWSFLGRIGADEHRCGMTGTVVAIKVSGDHQIVTVNWSDGTTTKVHNENLSPF